VAKKNKKASKKAKKSSDVLLVGTKVKMAIRNAGCNAGGDAVEGLNNWVHWLINQATQRASSNKRKTVRSHDFMV
jgi:histone H3/H4